MPFKLAAPDTLDGLARSEVRLTGDDHATPGALVTYGQGLGTIVVTEHAAAAGKDSASPLDALPGVTINGATGHELVTALGTVVAVRERRRLVHGRRLGHAVRRRNGGAGAHILSGVGAGSGRGARPRQALRRDHRRRGRRPDRRRR